MCGAEKSQIVLKHENYILIFNLVDDEQIYS